MSNKSCPEGGCREGQEGQEAINHVLRVMAEIYCCPGRCGICDCPAGRGGGGGVLYMSWGGGGGEEGIICPRGFHHN